jgi:hypothetical protein
MRFYKKYWHIFTIILLIVWILFTPSHFQKGGVDEEFYFMIIAFVISLSLLINFRFDKFQWLERMIISIAFAFISLVIITLLIGPFVVETFYQDKIWFLWETKHRIFINTIYYGLISIILIIPTSTYFKFREQARIKRI